jgi:hypothetical protein
MELELQKLRKELADLKKDFNYLKDNLRTEIIAQQTNTRDPMRSDKGEVILKKNFNMKSRVALPNLAKIDHVASFFFNNVNTGKKNALYIGHDGGFGQRYANYIANVATEGFSVRLENFNNGDGEPLSEKVNVISAVKIGNDAAVSIGGYGEKGGAGIGTCTDKGIFTNFSSNNFAPNISILQNKPMKINVFDANFNQVSTETGYTGSFAVGTRTVSVVGGLITNIS